MGSRIEIRRIEGGQVVSDGFAEVVNVIRYEGNGMYLADCIFEADGTGEAREARFDIDIENHIEQMNRVRNAPPPPVQAVRKPFSWLFQTQDATKRKGG